MADLSRLADLRRLLPVGASWVRFVCHLTPDDFTSGQERCGESLQVGASLGFGPEANVSDVIPIPSIWICLPKCCPKMEMTLEDSHLRGNWCDPTTVALNVFSSARSYSLSLHRARHTDFASSLTESSYPGTSQNPPDSTNSTGSGPNGSSLAFSFPQVRRHLLASHIVHEPAWAVHFKLASVWHIIQFHLRYISLVGRMSNTRHILSTVYVHSLRRLQVAASGVPAGSFRTVFDIC